MVWKYYMSVWSEELVHFILPLLYFRSIEFDTRGGHFSRKDKSRSWRTNWLTASKLGLRNWPVAADDPSLVVIECCCSIVVSLTTLTLLSNASFFKWWWFLFSWEVCKTCVCLNNKCVSAMTQNVFETYCLSVLLGMVSEKKIDPITTRSFRWWWQKLPRISRFCDYNWWSFDQVVLLGKKHSNLISLIRFGLV